jgi:hypothetical protein
MFAPEGGAGREGKQGDLCLLMIVGDRKSKSGNGVGCPQSHIYRFLRYL